MKHDDAGPSDAATPKTKSDATQGATQWLSVARVAELEGVSVRAVQRRCQSGKYRARRVQTAQGERLEVDAATLTTQRRDAREQGHDDETHRRRDAKSENAHADAKGDQEAAPDFAARYVAQIEAENAFLRAAVEQHQRSEAELRAALREALKAQPRQLTEPTKSAPQNRYTQSPSQGSKEPEPNVSETAGQSRSGARNIFRALLGLK